MTGALISAIGTIFAGALATLVAYFVKRTDRVAKATRANMADQQYTMRLVGTIRDDYWALSDWAYSARQQFAELLGEYRLMGGKFKGLPRIPIPRHRELEAQHARAEKPEKNPRWQAPVNSDDD